MMTFNIFSYHDGLELLAFFQFYVVDAQHHVRYDLRGFRREVNGHKSIRIDS